jgi:hypothetical protein
MTVRADVNFIARGGEGGRDGEWSGTENNWWGKCSEEAEKFI